MSTGLQTNAEIAPEDEANIKSCTMVLSEKYVDKDLQMNENTQEFGSQMDQHNTAIPIKQGNLNPTQLLNRKTDTNAETNKRCSVSLRY